MNTSNGTNKKPMAVYNNALSDDQKATISNSAPLGAKHSHWPCDDNKSLVRKHSVFNSISKSDDGGIKLTVKNWQAVIALVLLVIFAVVCFNKAITVKDVDTLVLGTIGGFIFSAIGIAIVNRFFK